MTAKEPKQKFYKVNFAIVSQLKSKMDFNLIKSLLPNWTISVFDDDMSLYEDIRKVANQIVLDESGYTANDSLEWLIEPYSYIITKLSIKKVQNISEEQTTQVNKDYMRALDILHNKKTSPVVKLTSGIVRGTIW